MKIKTSDLIGPALDWAVAKCEGLLHRTEFLFGDLWIDFYTASDGYTFKPSTDPAQGWPIIDRQRIGTCPTGNMWWATKSHSEQKLVFSEYGPTSLVAGMRCHVASDLGDYVEIPDDLPMPNLQPQAD